VHCILCARAADAETAVTTIQLQTDDQVSEPIETFAVSMEPPLWEPASLYGIFQPLWDPRQSLWKPDSLYGSLTVSMEAWQSLWKPGSLWNPESLYVTLIVSMGTLTVSMEP
jgi:hypothetical protein